MSPDSDPGALKYVASPPGGIGYGSERSSMGLWCWPLVDLLTIMARLFHRRDGYVG